MNYIPKVLKASAFYCYCWVREYGPLLVSSKVQGKLSKTSIIDTRHTRRICKELGLNKQ